MTASKKSSSPRFPDLYALLGLEPLESDLSIIAAALHRLQAQLQSRRAAIPVDSSTDRLERIVELGKQHLLNADKKARYDRQWQQFHSRPTPNRTPAPLAALAAEVGLAGLLPEGDPSEAFRIDEYKRLAALQPQPDFKADFDKLHALLRPTYAKIEELSSNKQITSAEHSLSGSMAASTVTALVPGQANENAARASTPIQDSPARLRRRQRERRILWIAIGGLAGLAAVLAVGYRWSKPDEPTGAGAVAAGASFNTPTESSTMPSAAIEPTQRRSGLPGVQGIAPDQDLTSNIDELVPVTPPETSLEPGQATETVVSEPMASQQKNTIRQATMEQEAISPAAPSSDQPQLTDVERANWATAMDQTQQLIGQQQYAAAQQQLDANEKLAKTGLQRSQLRRLGQICSLAEEFQQALRKAISGLSAGEVIIVASSTPVGVVDSTEDSITIRMRGENRKFLLTELPIGLAFALSDLQMDPDAASTLARKAAFAWTHAAAAGSDVAARRARDMLAAAAAGGAVDPDLLEIFSDDYQLDILATQSE